MLMEVFHFGHDGYELLRTRICDIISPLWNKKINTNI